MADELKKPEVNEIATAEKDIDIFAGWIKRLENPDPVLRTESAGKGIKLYDEVARDSHAGAVLDTRYRAVVKNEWDVMPASDKRRDIEIADFAKEVLLASNYDLGREKLLASILYGFAVSEIMWEVSGGDIWIKEFLDKRQSRFVFDLDRKLRLLTPQNMIYGDEVPDRKFLVLTYGSADNPYGEGLGRRLWWPVWFKKNGIKFWVMFAEKFGSPTSVGKYPTGTSSEDQNKLLDAIKAIQQETGVVIPETMAVELLEAARQSSVNTYQSLCDFMNAEISKSVLGETLTTEIGRTGGAYAASQTHEGVRQDILKADADALCECQNNFLIRWIVDFNFGPQKIYPRVWIRTEEAEDLKTLSERDKILVKDIGLPVAKKYFYEAYEIPEPQADEELVTAPAIPNPFGGLNPPSPTFPKGGSFGISKGGNVSFADVTPELEISMEAQRQRLVSQYFSRLSSAFGGLRDDALREIQDMLLRSPGMSEAEFTSAVYRVLQNSYSGISEEAVSKAVSPIYSFYRLSDKAAWLGEKPGVAIAFDGVDRNTIEALTKIDTFYLSQFVNNQDMQGSVMKYLQQTYLEHGEGLFGRGSQGAIDAFRGQFADELKGLEDWQIRRIVDTSVTRMRSLGDLRQAVLANVDMRVYVTRGERACDICKGHMNEIVPAGRMETAMLTAAKDPEQFGVFNEVPTYHPNCVCRLVMNV